MTGRNMVLLICGLAIAATLALFGTLQIVRWITLSHPYAARALATWHAR
jgi:hypothetical protein